jgi:hypothetical protein
MQPLQRSDVAVRVSDAAVIGGKMRHTDPVFGDAEVAMHFAGNE